MACALTTGISLGCRDATGGVKEFYLANVPSTGVTVTQNATGMVTTLGSTLTWYKYVPRKQTASWNDNVTPNDQNGTVYYEQKALIPIARMEQSKRNEIASLAQANMVMIVKDQEDRYWLLGQANGITLAASNAGSGTAYGDRNGYELNFEGYEPEPAPETEYAAFSADISATTIT